MTLICLKIDVTTNNTPLVLFTAQWMFACEMIEMIQLVRWLNSFRSSALTFLSSAVWQFRGLAQLWPTPAAFCWLCFTLIDDVGSRWVWLLQSDSRATWYGTDVSCVVTQFIWVFSGPRAPVTEPKVPKLVGGAQMCLLSGVLVF